MARVEIYKRSHVNGKNYTIPEVVAHTRDVQFALQFKAQYYATKARAILAKHRDKGHSRIRIEHGRIDWYVILEDRGNAAYAIEHWTNNGANAPVAPLRRAFGFRVRGR